MNKINQKKPKKIKQPTTEPKIKQPTTKPKIKQTAKKAKVEQQLKETKIKQNETGTTIQEATITTTQQQTETNTTIEQPEPKIQQPTTKPKIQQPTTEPKIKQPTTVANNQHIQTISQNSNSKSNFFQNKYTQLAILFFVLAIILLFLLQSIFNPDFFDKRTHEAGTKAIGTASEYINKVKALQISYRNNKKELENQLNLLRDSIVKDYEKVNHIDIKIKELEKILDKIDAEIESVKEEIDKTEKELAIAQAKEYKLETEKTDLLTELAKLQEELKTETNADTIQKIQKRISEIESRLKEIESELKKIKKEIERLKAKLEALRDRLKILQRNQSAIKERISILQTEREQIWNIIQKKEQLEIQIKEKIQTCEQEIQNLEAEKVKMQAFKQTLIEALSNYNLIYDEHRLSLKNAGQVIVKVFDAFTNMTSDSLTTLTKGFSKIACKSSKKILTRCAFVRGTDKLATKWINKKGELEYNHARIHSLSKEQFDQISADIKEEMKLLQTEHEAKLKDLETFKNNLSQDAIIKQVALDSQETDTVVEEICKKQLNKLIEGETNIEALNQTIDLEQDTFDSKKQEETNLNRYTNYGTKFQKNANDHIKERKTNVKLSGKNSIEALEDIDKKTLEKMKYEL